jgi:integrase
MGRGIYKLSGADLRRSKPGLFGDGGGLWLQVTRGAAGRASRSWLFRYTVDGRRREMGLGSLITISLSEAREAALQCRKQVLAGIDPIEQRRVERAAQVAASKRVITFDEAAAAYIAAHRDSWRSERHAQQWPATLRKYAGPVFGKLPVAQIDTPIIMRALEPIWKTTPKTAANVRQRIEAVLDWATVRGYRTGDNPARWAGHLQHLLPAPSKIRKVEHLAALPVADVPAFMAALRKVEGTTARAIEFTILAAARRGEVLGARWQEFDLKQGVWSVPAARMKAGVEHRVPLTARAIEIIHGQRAIRRNDLVFPGNGERMIWGDAVARQLKAIGCEATLHGFRSSFRDWCGEQTNFPREIAEAALAHRVGDAVEKAYRRGDALAKRRKLMDAWASYCGRPPSTGATVTPIRGRGSNA